MVENKKNELYAVDFFCSAGGVTCGFKQAGINILGGIDIDSACELTYKTNNNAEYLCADVSHLDKKVIAQIFRIKKNQDNLIFVGCSPCQYYSNIKTDKTKSEETRLLLEDFQEFVEYYKPGYVFIENVPGLKRDMESPLGKFKTFLTENGYVFDENIINAKYFGVPQNRRRYILIATRLKEKISLPKENRNAIKTVRDAIGDYSKFYPILSGHKDKSPFIHTSADLSEINKKD